MGKVQLVAWCMDGHGLRKPCMLGSRGQQKLGSGTESALGLEFVTVFKRTLTAFLEG